MHINRTYSFKNSSKTIQSGKILQQQAVLDPAYRIPLISDYAPPPSFRQPTPQPCRGPAFLSDHPGGGPCGGVCDPPPAALQSLRGGGRHSDPSGMGSQKNG